MSIDENLTLLLDSGAPAERRWHALRTLRDCALSATDKVQILNRLLKDQSGEIRMGAAMNAAVLGNETTVKILSAMIETDEDQQVRRLALEALARLQGSSLIPTLEEFLKHGDRIQQSNALGALTGMRSEEAIRLIREAFERNPDPGFRFRAALGLAHLKDPRAVAVLVACLEGEGQSGIDRIIAAVVLSALGVRAAVEYVHSLLCEPEEELSDTERRALVFLLRGQLGLLTERSDQEVMEQARQWVAAELHRLAKAWAKPDIIRISSMKPLPLAVSPEAGAFIVEKLQMQDDDPDLAGVLPALYFAFSYQTRDSQDQITEWCPHPFFNIGWHRPEEITKGSFSEIEICGHRLLAEHDALEHLQGRELILETVEVGYPTAGHKKVQLLRAKPASDDG